MGESRTMSESCAMGKSHTMGDSLTMDESRTMGESHAMDDSRMKMRHICIFRFTFCSLMFKDQ